MNEVNWQARYENADTPWDKGEHHPMIARWTQDREIEGDILVPGCGRGWDLQAWGVAYPQHAVIGIDLAPSAVSSARRLCQDLSNVTVHEADFFSLESWYEGNRVGLIWEHTCFCAIPPPLREVYAKTVAALLPSGGRLIGAFFTDITDRASGPPWNTTMSDIECLFSPWFVIEQPVAEHLTFAGREGEERSLIMHRR